MQAVNCPRCGRVFTKIRTSICPACVKEDDETFELVREYVKENPNHSIGDVSEETKVSIKRITQYIRDGRLEISSGMSADIGCSQCGKPIKSGRFCEKCAAEIKSSILKKPKEENKPIMPSTKGKMRTIKLK
jgi:flagellar operon protein (TIGR03826 family)